MRERYLEAFDLIRVDCLNGDKYRTGKITPDGAPDPSIFSTESDPVGIQVGTAIATSVRKEEHAPADGIEFQDLWGRENGALLTATTGADPAAIYDRIEPALGLGLPFQHASVSEGWFDWPQLPELFPVSFPGVNTSRDAFLVDVDIERLEARIGDSIDARLSHAEIARRYPRAMKDDGAIRCAGRPRCTSSTRRSVEGRFRVPLLPSV